MEQPPFAPKSVIKRRSWKRREICNLYVEQLGVDREVEHRIKDRRSMIVQAEHEATVHTNPVRLDAANRLLVLGPSLQLPVGLEFQAGESRFNRALQADEHLGTTAFAHEAEQ